AAVPALVRSLDTLDRVVVAGAGRAATFSVLGTHFAARLAVLGAARQPVPQLLVTVASRTRLPLPANNEETLIAGWPSPTDRERAFAALAAVVELRVKAQEPPWFPGDGGPDAADLVQEFALGGVTFGQGVPAGWRPYYLRELQTSLRDMEIVYPGLSFNGAH